MSEKYTAVCFITMRCKASIETREDGVGIRLLEEPVRVSDSTIFVSKDQLPPSQQHIDAVKNVLPIAIVQRDAETIKLPDNVEEGKSTVDVKKEDLN